MLAVVALPSGCLGSRGMPAHSGDLGQRVDARAVVAAPDRTASDRAADERRHPVAFLEFLKLKQGARVADLGAGGGYTTELLARAVGPQGAVFGQNNALTIERYVGQSWPARLKREVNRKVVRMDLEYEAPFVPESQALDLVTLMFSYHDVVVQGGDRAEMNLAVLRALKPGGHFVIADHSAEPGSGLAAATKLHRIEREIVRREVENAGFEFVEDASFLEDDSDDMTSVSYEVGFRTDRYILKFVKPE